MLIDTHTHIDIISADIAEQDKIIERALSGGVGLMINAGVDMRQMESVRDLSKRHSCVRYAAGMHPEILNESGNKLDINADLLAEEKYLSDPACCAIGEIGLDYFHNKLNARDQIGLFELQLHLAVRFNKPVLIHARDAWDDTFSAMEPFKGRLKGIFHCFSGGIEEVRRCLDLGFFISFAGNLTYPKAENLRTSAEFAPVERAFLETDAPYLAPVPMRGKRNEPAFVAHTYDFYSALKKMNVEAVSAVHAAKIKVIFPGIIQA